MLRQPADSVNSDKAYTVIFAFSDDRVLLRRKTHPAWQNGLWNGLGGKLSIDDFTAEVDDYPALTAARRKLTQEAELEVPIDRFTEMITLHFPAAMIHILHLDLTAAEAERVGAYERSASGEYNRWFTTDEINALVNEDSVALSEASIEHNDNPPYGVGSALALLDLIYTMIPWWDGTVEDE